MRYVLLLLASVGLGLLLTFFGALWRPLTRVLRALMMGVVAMMGLAAAAITVAGVEGGAWWAIVLGGGIGLIALRLGWALRRPRRAVGVHVPRVALAPASSEPHWSSFEARLDWVGRQQARRARAAIDGFLAERGSPSLDHEHRQLLLSCEKRVSQLLDTCVDRCRNANRQEQERYVDDTLDTLVQIGGEAERARREVREADDRRLEVLHRYFDGVIGSRDDPDRR